MEADFRLGDRVIFDSPLATRLSGRAATIVSASRDGLVFDIDFGGDEPSVTALLTELHPISELLDPA